MVTMDEAGNDDEDTKREDHKDSDDGGKDKDHGDSRRKRRRSSGSSRGGGRSRSKSRERKRSRSRSRSPAPRRVDHEAGIAVQDHEVLVIVVAEVEEVIGALTTTMTKKATGSTLLTWTVMLASETWRSLWASMGRSRRSGWLGLCLALPFVSFDIVRMQKRPSVKLMAQRFVDEGSG